ncbi:MAG TPA: hypothetical protein VGO55_01335 [Allosphingosinicella sp.]|jgi:hypothetical protein|nr:hypothetical protein [Allosphingosinicella sp.]
MKGFALLLGGTLLIAGCTEAEGPFVDNLVRQAAAEAGRGGNVQQVRMTKQGDGTYSGFATVRAADSQVGRFNCTARRTEGRNYEARCVQALDAVLINQLKAELRQSFVANGMTVLALELSGQGEDRVTGHADLRAANGEEGRMACAGAREPSGRFPVNCSPPATPIPGSQTAQPAPEEGAQPAPEEAPADEGQ